MDSSLRPSRPSVSFICVFLLLAAAVILVFGHFLNPWGSKVISLPGEDLSGQFVWWRQFGFDQLRQGHLALWNPHLFSGAPYFAGFQSALLYPPNWLYLVFPQAFAINFGIALHTLLAGFFMYLWMDYRRFHPAACFLAALLFMFGGSYFLHVVPGHLPNLCTMAWIPLFFLALDGYARERSLGWVGLGLFALSMEVLAGHIQYFYYTLLVAGFYVLLQVPGASRKISLLAGPALMVAGACCLTAVQLLTGFDTAWEGLRGQHLSLRLIASNDLMPERLWSWLMPGFYGDWKPGSYWGGAMYWEAGLFASVTAFVLALYALGRWKDPLKTRAAWLILFLILLAMGIRTPLYGLFYHFCPFFQYFRGAGKFNILITLLVGLLAAAGLDDLMKSEKIPAGLARWTGGFCGLVFSLALLFHFSPPWGLASLFGKFAGKIPGMVHSLAICGATLAALTGLALLGNRAKIFRYGFLALAFLELFFFARANRPEFDLTALKAKVQGVQAVYQKDPGDYRILVDPTNDALGTTGSDIWGNDPTVSFRYAQFITYSQGLDVYSESLLKPLFRTYPPMLGLTRLRYVFEDQGAGWKVTPVHLREMPRMALVGQWTLASGDGALKLLADPKFDPLKRAVVESPPGFEPAPGKIKGGLKWTDLSTDEIEIEADNSRPCLLVISDNYSRGWRVFPAAGDRQENYSVMPVNFFQRGIPLQPGSHHFRLVYLPKSFVLGKWISLVSLGFYLVFLAALGWNRKTPSSP